MIFLAIGGSIGAFIAYRIPMTAMPELVAGFHSLGSSSCICCDICIYKSSAFNLGTPGNIKLASLIEMAIGAVEPLLFWFCIAFLKLQGIMSGAL